MTPAARISSFAAAAVLLVALGIGAPAGRENAGARARAKGFADYEIVAQRNIFDPNRSGSRSSRNSGGNLGPVADQVQLVGTWLTNRQVVAFTEGNKPEYTRTPALGASFEGWRFTEITTGHVVLVKGANKIVWQVGQRLERNGKGEWQLAGTSESPMQPAASAPTAPPSESDAKDILQQMRERRQREMNKQ